MTKSYIQTSVRIEKDVLTEAKQQGIVISRFLNDTLRSALNKSEAQRHEVLEEIQRLDACLLAQKEILRHIDKDEIKQVKKKQATEFDEVIIRLKRMYIKVIEGRDKGQFNNACKQVAEAYNMDFEQVFNRVVK